MPLAQTCIADATPPEHVQAPASAAHTNLSADEPVWAAARRSYVEDGCSSAVVAERHGLHARTVRHHAATEGWGEMRAKHRAAAVHMASQLAEDDPVDALVAEHRETDRLRLLVAPSAAGSLAFVAKAVNAALARGAFHEAEQLVRLFDRLKRDPEALERAFRGGRGANDRLLSAYYSRVYEPAD